MARFLSIITIQVRKKIYFVSNNQECLHNLKIILGQNLES